MSSAPSKPSILVADNDRTVLELLQIRLGVAGFQPLAARAIPAAMALVDEAHPIAAIIDADLPGGDPFQLLGALQKQAGSRPCATLFTGRKLTSAAVRRALKLGAADALAKPFSGADVLERIGRMLKHPREPVAEHMVEARCLEPKDLASAYPHEASEHRRILFARGSGMSQSWQTFRQFLVDLGPAPSPDHLATRLTAADLTYAAGKVAWIHRDHQPSLIDRWAMVEPQRPAPGQRWTTVRGAPIEYQALADRLGLPVDAMSLALRDRPTADELVQHASIAETLAQVDAPWLATERQDAFMVAYRMWHLQVQPAFAAAATPAFLYMFSALPGMIKTRDGLAELELWAPKSAEAKAERDRHPLWRRFSEAVVRVDAARQDLTAYKSYDLESDLDVIWERVKTAEARFRGAGQIVRRAA